MVHGPEESAESLAFASEPLIGSLVNILSANSADSYDGGGSNRHGSFDLGNQESNRKQPLPNLGSMLQVDYNFIDVEYRYGFSQVCEYYYFVTGPPRQPRMPRIGPCQVLAATLTLSQPGGADCAHPILGSLAG